MPRRQSSISKFGKLNVVHEHYIPVYSVLFVIYFYTLLAVVCQHFLKFDLICLGIECSRIYLYIDYL